MFLTRALLKKKPLVSVLIPASNAGAYLRSSIQSIISQSSSKLEILIIDDGSTDGYMDAIADLKDSCISFLLQKQSG